MLVYDSYAPLIFLAIYVAMLASCVIMTKHIRWTIPTLMSKYTSLALNSHVLYQTIVVK